MVVAPTLSGRPTWAEIDLDALVDNYRTLQSLLASDCGSRIADFGLKEKPARRELNPQSAIRILQLIPVIKANAYGHGAVAVARSLAEAGAGMFAVAIVEEALELRKAGISQEILVMEGAWPGQETEILHHQITPAVYTPEQVRRLDHAARKNGKIISVHLKVDTGMTRLGAPWDQLDPIIAALREAVGVRLAATFSHLACAEEDDSSYTREQTRRFQHAVSHLLSQSVDPGRLHLANSAGLLYHPAIHYQTVRPGIALYGYPPAPERCTVNLKPVLSLKTCISRICTIAAGESIGYNRRFIASRRTRAATLPIGYADGYPRALTGKARVIVRDRWADVLGTISMDMIVIDVTELPEVVEGQEVLLLGSSPRCRMDAAVWAELIGTIPYEILCGIGPRVPRVEIRGQAT